MWYDVKSCGVILFNVICMHYPFSERYSCVGAHKQVATGCDVH